MIDRYPVGFAEERIAKEINQEILNSLSRLGILCRVFYRVKSETSIVSKIYKKRENYLKENKKLQDLIGIRVALYFSDDSIVAQKLLRKMYECISASISEQAKDIFGPVRCNLVFRLPEKYHSQISVLSSESLVDSSFEVQFRTMLSEGWHEVEHDLRYKKTPYWENSGVLDRALNGVIATLENCDWTMIKIFDELSYKKLQEKNIKAMLEFKFRIRVHESPEENHELWNYLIKEEAFCKRIYDIDRNDFLKKLTNLGLDIPLTRENIVFLCNRFFIKEKSIFDLESVYLKHLFESK